MPPLSKNGRKKIKVSDLSKKTGIHRNMITLLYKETAVRVELEVMNKLCEFFRCSVGELFEYISDTNDEKQQN